MGIVAQREELPCLTSASRASPLAGAKPSHRQDWKRSHLVARPACEEIFFLSSHHKKYISKGKKNQCQHWQRLFLICICFDFSLSKALRPLRSRKRNKPVWTSYLQVLGMKSVPDWDCPASLSAGERVGCDHWNLRLEDWVVHKGTSDEQGTSVGVEAMVNRLCYLWVCHTTHPATPE